MKESISSLQTRAEAFMKNESMIFIIEKYNGNSQLNRKFHPIERFYNGFVLAVHADMIVIWDAMTSKEIPLPIDFISMLEISTRGNEIELREAFRKWKVENGRN